MGQDEKGAAPTGAPNTNGLRVRTTGSAAPARGPRTNAGGGQVWAMSVTVGLGKNFYSRQTITIDRLVCFL